MLHTASHVTITLASVHNCIHIRTLRIFSKAGTETVAEATLALAEGKNSHAFNQHSSGIAPAIAGVSNGGSGAVCLHRAPKGNMHQEAAFSAFCMKATTESHTCGTECLAQPHQAEPLTALQEARYPGCSEIHVSHNLDMSFVFTSLSEVSVRMHVYL